MKLSSTSHSRNTFRKRKNRNPSRSPRTPSRLHLKKILVPVDFSECSRKAVDYAVSFASQNGAELMLLHVVALVPPPPDIVVLETDALSSRYQGESEKELSRWKRKIVPQVDVEVTIRHGMDVSQEIIAAAQEWNSDLIVVGNQGRSALTRILMGSTAERVVRHAPCPVLVIHKEEHDFLWRKGKMEGTKRKSSFRDGHTLPDANR